MNIVKNMEAIFIAAAVLACSAAYANATTVDSHTAQVAAKAAVPSLTITAKRLTAAERAEMARH